MLELLLKEAVYPMGNSKELFHLWTFVVCANVEMEHRIYYKKSEEDGLGFEYVGIVESSHEADHESFDLRSQEVDILFYGIASFEGIKHHFNGYAEDGYWFYPDIESITEMLIQLRSLEKKYCRDHA